MEKNNNSDKTQKKVFITGATGFLASHCIKLLLEKGYLITSSTRSLENPIIKELYNITPNAKKNLKIIKADLLDAESWKETLKGFDYLLHLASPVFMKPPKDEKKVLNPAITGTKNVLLAAIHNNLKKVVITSSIAAISGLKKKPNNWYTPSDFSSPTSPQLYSKSKVLAEKQAWEIYEKYKKKLNLSVICPGVIIDETLTTKRSPCNFLMKILFNIPVLFDTYLPIVSARDCAEAHFRCLERPEESRGKRYILVENTYSCRDLVMLLEGEFGRYGYWFWKVRVPNFFFWGFGLLSWDLKAFVDNLGVRPVFDNDLVKGDLGVGFENHRNYFLRTIHSMIKNNKLKNRID